jgi:hypothetical protein
MGGEPVRERAKTTFEMPRHQYMTHDHICACGDGREIRRDHCKIALHSTAGGGTFIARELEIGQIARDHPVKQVKHLGRAIEIRVQHERQRSGSGRGNLQ